VRGLAQGVELVRIEEPTKLVELPGVVDAQRGAVRRELDQDVEVLPSSELLLRLVIHISVEPAPDVAPGDVLRVLVVGAHDAHLSPHPGGVPVSSLGGSTASGARMAASKMRFHDTILLPLK